jgi:type III pantothenate kinase
MIDVVVDIGNSRVKWGQLIGTTVRQVTVVDHEPLGWTSQAAFLFEGPIRWTVASVAPATTKAFHLWCAGRGEECRVLSKASDIPLSLNLENTSTVGIDRLLAAFAAKKRTTPAVVLTLGTAITVDLVDDEGVFQGGAILPGTQLLAKSLNDYTAQLPLLPLHSYQSFVAPGKNTEAAIAVGLHSAVLGACRVLIERYSQQCRKMPIVFLAGGGIGELNAAELAVSNEVQGPFPLVLEGLAEVVRSGCL